MSEYSSQTVAQLKETLKAKGLSTAGVKSDLIARLEQADATGAAEPAKEEPPADAADAGTTTEPLKGEPVAATEAPAASETAQPAASESAALNASSSANTTKQEGDLTVIYPTEKKQDQQEQQQEPKEEEKPKELSPEERKAAAIDLLEKKIARAKKFNDEEAQQSAEKDLARVRKFGVDPDTALAREIGLTSGRETLSSKTGRVSKNNGHSGGRRNSGKFRKGGNFRNRRR